MSILVVRPEEGARRVALGFIGEAEASAERLRGDDPEALHDLRVALRRLRSTLRAYRGALHGALSKRRRAELKALVDFTSGGRDAEVQLGWLEGVRASLAPAERSGSDAWAAALQETKDRVYGGLRDDKLEDLELLLRRIRRDLSEYRVRYVVHEEPATGTFGALVADAAATHLEELLETLTRVRSLEDEAVAHEARIFGKRLRYVLEPVREAVPDSDVALKQLKRLQELLGELQDLAVCTAALSQAVERAALERARTEVGLVVAVAEDAAGPPPPSPAEPGLLALLRVAQARKREVFASLLGHWVEGPELGRLRETIETLVAAIRHKTRGEAPREIERKYLLTAVPPFVRGKPYARLAQGYVPGEAIVERVRRKSDRTGTRFFRTVKLGRGIERIEIEEPISRKLFTGLYALTEGKRVEKRRYAIEEAGFVWEVDVFTDRELVLCEVELSSPTEQPELPAWLAPYVEREVTDEDEYVNLNLAK
jgi:CHAD domain-containing protein/CYTH domain-containing protein